MLNSLILFLHVATMFAVVALHSGPQILLYAATRSRRPAAVAAIADVYAQTGRAVPPLGILGGLFGLAAGLLGGFNLLAPWLLIAYALFAVLVLFGGIVSVPYISRLGAAALASDATYDELAGRRLTAIVLVDALIYALIVADMVVKPFGPLQATGDWEGSMDWLRRHAWQLLLALTALIAVIGLNPVMNGINEDPSVPLGLAGMTAAQLESDNARSFRLIDAQARFGGLDLIVIGTLLSAILVGAFRHNQRWSWWAMWLLPFWGISVFATILRIGVAADQTPPSPYYSGPIIAALSAALLLIAAPRFFGHRALVDAAGVPGGGA